MTQQARGTFRIMKWDEASYDERTGSPKLTRVHVEKEFHGEFDGNSTLEYLMMYRPDGSATFVGLERMVGALDGRSGSFVLEHRGTFVSGTAKIHLQAVPGSGTGELKEISGRSELDLGHAEEYQWSLEYGFE